MLNLKAFMAPEVLTPEMRAAVADLQATDRAQGFVPARDLDGCERVRIDPFPGTAAEGQRSH